ncbi:MAG TPA: ATP-binding protein [Acidobacteriota bacterium]|nr:ATP-binding protein [Acidobacteriota bacterium]
MSLSGDATRTVRIAIRSAGDLVLARQRGRMLALDLGFRGGDVTVIAAAISEVARNVVEHAVCGEVSLSETRHDGRTGLTVVVTDEGPGMFDAMRVAEVGGTERQGGPGLGLPGVRAIMDEFEIESTPGRGTTVRMTKWLR